MWEMAARHKNAEAAFLLGLWHARMDEYGNRTSDGASSTSFKKAIRWLTQAGEQGLAKAWYALSLIYQKAEFSQRNMADAQRYLEIAANLGHPQGAIRTRPARMEKPARRRIQRHSGGLLAPESRQQRRNGSGTGTEPDRHPGQTGIVGPGPALQNSDA